MAIHVRKQVLRKGRAIRCPTIKTLPSCPISKESTANRYRAFRFYHPKNRIATTLEKNIMVSLQEIQPNFQINNNPPGLSPTRHSCLIQSRRLLLLTQESVRQDWGLQKFRRVVRAWQMLAQLPDRLAGPSHRSIPGLGYEVIDHNSLDCTPYDEAYVCFPANLVQCNRPCELIEQVRFHEIS